MLCIRLSRDGQIPEVLAASKDDAQPSFAKRTVKGMLCG